MPKSMTVFGFFVTAILLLVFGLDLATGWLFGKPLVVDIGFLAAGLILGYLSWNTYRELA